MSGQRAKYRRYSVQNPRAPFLAGNRLRTKLILRGVYFQKFALCNEIPPPSSAVADLRMIPKRTRLEHLMTHALIIEDNMAIAAALEDRLAELGFDSFEQSWTEEDAVAAAD